MLVCGLAAVSGWIASAVCVVGMVFGVWVGVKVGWELIWVDRMDRIGDGEGVLRSCMPVPAYVSSHEKR